MVDLILYKKFNIKYLQGKISEKLIPKKPTELDLLLTPFFNISRR